MAIAEPTMIGQPLRGASLGQAIGRFFRKYATFAGRASLSEFWWWTLFTSLVYIVVAVATVAIGLATGELNADGDTFYLGAAATVGLVVLGVWALITLVPQIAVTVRRLHDANFSGWMYLLTFVPSVGSLIVLILTLMPAKPEGARFDNG